MTSPFLWYRDKDEVAIGGVRRYTISYSPVAADKKFIFLRLKNIEKTSIRAIHLLNGPFILYCHVVPHNYDHLTKFDTEDHEREVFFNNELKPGQTFNVKLKLNSNSKVDGTDTFRWTVDIISQIVITRNTSVVYDIMIGDDIDSMKKLNHGSFKSLTTSLASAMSFSSDTSSSMKFNVSTNPQLAVAKKTQDDLWSTTPKDLDKPIHLVIITHGIFSNLTADMLYTKEMLESRLYDDNVLVKGYDGNAGRTEIGVKKLGSRQGRYIMDLIVNLNEQGIKIDKISFVGHSLGGLTQLYSIMFILDNDPKFFSDRGISPQNLVFMACPLLGILNEYSFILSWLLDLGTFGKTGRDLTLSRPNFLKKKSSVKQRDRFKPILETLPLEPVHDFLSSCENLVIFANIMNDGIVPLRTSGLLYLDYLTLDNVKGMTNESKFANGKADNGDDNKKIGEIPADQPDPTKANVTDKYKKFISLNFNLTSDRKAHKVRERLLKLNAKGSVVDTLEEGEESGDDELEDEDSSQLTEDTINEQAPTLNIPPKASIIESALNTILCPTPNYSHISEPESRKPVIFHDRMYKFKDLPPDDSDKDNSIFHHKMKKQVKIARNYHHELDWRKILVRLPPDAHNNIIVRRRFANGYGWGVVDYLCDIFADKKKERPERVAKM